MTDASTFHRSSTALVVQDLQNDVVTEGGVFVASGAPRPTAHGRSKIVLTGWITNAGRSRRPRPAHRTGPKRATGLSTGHWANARTVIRST
jgi:hypothetical protein